MNKPVNTTKITRLPLQIPDTNTNTRRICANSDRRVYRNSSFW